MHQSGGKGVHCPLRENHARRIRSEIAIGNCCPVAFPEVFPVYGSDIPEIAGNSPKGSPQARQ